MKNQHFSSVYWRCIWIQIFFSDHVDRSLRKENRRKNSSSFHLNRRKNTMKFNCQPLLIFKYILILISFCTMVYFVTMCCFQYAGSVFSFIWRDFTSNVFVNRSFSNSNACEHSFKSFTSFSCCNNLQWKSFTFRQIFTTVD